MLDVCLDIEYTSVYNELPTTSTSQIISIRKSMTLQNLCIQFNVIIQ